MSLPSSPPVRGRWTSHDAGRPCFRSPACHGLQYCQRRCFTSCRPHVRAECFGACLRAISLRPALCRRRRGRLRRVLPQRADPGAGRPLRRHVAQDPRLGGALAAVNSVMLSKYAAPGLCNHSRVVHEGSPSIQCLHGTIAERSMHGAVARPGSLPSHLWPHALRQRRSGSWP